MSQNQASPSAKRLVCCGRMGPMVKGGGVELDLDGDLAESWIVEPGLIKDFC